MTREEWLASISADTGMTVQSMLDARAKRGRYPIACDCGEGICQGWRWSDPPENDDITAAHLAPRVTGSSEKR